MSGPNFSRDGSSHSAVSAKFAQACSPPNKMSWQAQVYAATDGGWTPPGAKR